MASEEILWPEVGVVGEKNADNYVSATAVLESRTLCTKAYEVHLFKILTYEVWHLLGNCDINASKQHNGIPLYHSAFTFSMFSFTAIRQ
jgi:hypothetical protein